MQALTVYDVTLFGIHMKFDSVAFTLPIGGGWSIYWYGICIAIGFLLAIIYCFKRAPRFGVDVDRLTDVVLVTTPVALLSARVYYILFDPSGTKIKSVSDFFGFSGGNGVSGLAIYGGVIGAAVMGLIMCRLRKVNVLDAFDLAASGFLIGQAIGRWGNFFNQEAYGSYTNSAFWGMTNQTLDGNVHPCFLYESIWCLIGFVILHFLGKKRRFSGQLALTYGAWYGFGRMFIEGLRTDSLYIGPLKVSQWLSGLLVIACVALLIWKFRKMAEAKVDETYTAMFDDIDPSSVKGVSYYEGDEQEGADSTGDTEDTTGSEQDAGDTDGEDAEPSENDDSNDKNNDGGEE